MLIFCFSVGSMTCECDALFQLLTCTIQLKSLNYTTSSTAAAVTFRLLALMFTSPWTTWYCPEVLNAVNGPLWQQTRYFLQQIKYGLGCLQLLPVDLALLTLEVLPSPQTTLLLSFSLARSTRQLETHLLLFIRPGTFTLEATVLATVRHNVWFGQLLLTCVFRWDKGLLWPGSGQPLENHFEVGG